MTSQLNATPPGLDFVEKFLNTIEFSEGREDFASGAAIERWAHARGVDVELSDADAGRIRAFREVMRSVLEANAGHGDLEEAWKRLAPHVSELRFSFSTAPAGFVAEGSGADHLIGMVVSAVHEAIQQGTFARLKVCPETTCRWAFYDRSKNSSGRWCSMAVCGNRNKARRRRTLPKGP